MLTTAQRLTITLAANQDISVPIQGKYLEIISCTQATIGIGFNGDQPQIHEPGKCYAGPGDGFKSIRFLDSGAGCTVVYRVSEQQIIGIEPKGLGDLLLQLQAINLDTDQLVLIKNLITAGNVDLAALEVLITAGNVDLAALEVLVTAGNVDLAALEVLVTAGNVDLAALETLLNASIIKASTDGDCGHIDIPLSDDGNGPDVACREVTYYTPAAQVYVLIDAALGDADNTHYLMIPNHEYTIAIDNPNKLRFHNQDAGAAVIVYWQWRN
jgi:hypothetical protein